MREVNEAWQVLQDPGRRRRYDDGRTTTHRSTGTGRTGGRTRSSVPVVADDDDDLVDVGPPMGSVTAGLFRHGPWIVLVVVLGLIFVVTAYATNDPGPGEVPPRVQAGACVNVSSGPTTTVVPCSGPHELRIVRRVRDGEACPTGTQKRRFGTDGFLDCVDTP